MLTLQNNEKEIMRYEIHTENSITERIQPFHPYGDYVINCVAGGRGTYIQSPGQEPCAEGMKVESFAMAKGGSQILGMCCVEDTSE